MNKFVAFFVLLAVSVVLAAPSSSEEMRALRMQPAVLHEEVHSDDGQFEIRYVTAEGTVVTERGWLIPTADGKGRVLIMEGEISYVAPDGVTYVTKFHAGLDGYTAEGAHLPIAPEPIAPVPVAVVA